MATRTPIFAIVGRPNVGKSTLFNRIIGKRRAVVEDVAGVTRDRNYALVESYAFPFYLVDTGGFEADSSDDLQMLVSEQARLAAEEADVVFAVFDGKAGCQPGDEDVVNLLRQIDKPIHFLVNKCDGVEQAILAADFYALGLEELHTVSALHGQGVKELVENSLRSLPGYESLCASIAARKASEADAAIQAAQQRESFFAEEEALQESNVPSVAGNLQLSPELEHEPEDIDFPPVFIPGENEKTPEAYLRENRLLDLVPRGARDLPLVSEPEPVKTYLPDSIECVRVALVGRPNAGKSTLLNTLVGEQRAITSPVAGTTRDPLDWPITRDGQKYLLVDTAGLRKKARIGDKVERYSSMRSLRAITECDVAVVLIDAVRGPSEQDAKIIGLAHDEGKGIVIVVNKWDLIEKDHKSVQNFKNKVRDTFKFSTYAPIVFSSALTGRRCPKVIEAVREVAYNRRKEVSTRALNQVLQRAMKRRSAPVVRGRPVKLFYASQIDTGPPRFVLFFNYPESVHFSYLRFLKNSIRDAFSFPGTDLKLVCRKRSQRG